MAPAENTGGEEPHLDTTDARQAVRTGYMWRVLALSLAFGVVVLLGAWLWIGASRPARPPGQGGQVRVAAPAAPATVARTPG